MSVTLEQLKDSRLPQRLGVCRDDQRIVEWANEAQRRLLQRPEAWDATLERVVFCLPSRCWFALPPWVATIQRAWFPTADQAKRIIIRNQWYVPTTKFCQHPCGMDSDVLVTDYGKTPIVNDFPCPARIFAKAVYPHDCDVPLVIKGRDFEDNIVRSTHGEGEVLLLNKVTDNIMTQGPVTSCITYNSIYGLYKPETFGEVEVWAQPIDNIRPPILLNQLAPEEKDGERRRYMLHVSCSPQMLECIVKVKHKPVRNDCDTFMIDNLDAIMEEILAVQAAERKQYEEEEHLMRKAKRRMDWQHRATNPTEQRWVRFHTAPSGNTQRMMRGI